MFCGLHVFKSFTCNLEVLKKVFDVFYTKLFFHIFPVTKFKYFLQLPFAMILETPDISVLHCLQYMYNIHILKKLYI